MDIDNCKIVPRGLTDHLVPRNVCGPEITVSGDNHNEEASGPQGSGYSLVMSVITGRNFQEILNL